MVKLSNKEIIDVVKYNDNSAIIVEKMPLFEEDRYKANYFVINFETGEKEVITKNAYLLKKFGSAYNVICKKINNFVQCESQILSNRNVLAVYPNGEAGIFDTNGEIIWSGCFKHNDNAVCGIALDGDYFWGYCQSENCVIRYNCENMNVDLRIGSIDSETFVSPSHISADDKCVYVCSQPDKVRMIDKTNFVVTDLAAFNAPLKRFYKFGKHSIICMENGCYLHNDNE